MQIETLRTKSTRAAAQDVLLADPFIFYDIAVGF